AVDKVMPKGVPDGYGKELGITYDEPLKALDVLAKLDGDLYDDGKIKFSDLSAGMQSRYMKMGMSVGCEFCCGAQVLIQRNGQPACSCAHSAGMRGLMKYLLKNTGMTDEQIMKEVLKVKAISFPKEMVQRYMEQSGMIQAQNTQNTELPEQVGGC
ncbi:MAG: hypothetical protein QMD85_05835, partial [Candidatus Aenigmarchaeota archaeon]|nr:hypothetical protein [Candidatus Aenigmarchaeota archaeon]